jgi:hypothetical protein
MRIFPSYLHEAKIINRESLMGIIVAALVALGVVGAGSAAGEKEREKKKDENSGWPDDYPNRHPHKQGNRRSIGPAHKR